MTDISARAKAIEASVRRETKRRYLSYIEDIAQRSCPKPLAQWFYDQVEIFPDRTIYWEKYNEMSIDGYDSSDCATQRYAEFLSALGPQGMKLRAPVPSPTAAQPPPPPPTAPRVPDPPNVFAPKPRVPVGGEEDLRALVIRACKDPAGLKGAQLPDFSWFPAPGYRFLGAHTDGMDSCQIQLWHYLLDRNEKGQRLDIDDVTQRAWGYQYRPQPSAPPCTSRGIWSKECYRN